MTPPVVRAAVPALHAAWGGALICVPARLLELTGEPRTPAACRVLRVLGARHLGQAAVTTAWRGPAALRAGSAVDLLHAASCAALAADARWRRAAAVGGVAAVALAAAGLAAARAAGPR